MDNLKNLAFYSILIIGTFKISQSFFAIVIPAVFEMIHSSRNDKPYPGYIPISPSGVDTDVIRFNENFDQAFQNIIGEISSEIKHFSADTDITELEKFDADCIRFLKKCDIAQANLESTELFKYHSDVPGEASRILSLEIITRSCLDEVLKYYENAIQVKKMDCDDIIKSELFKGSIVAYRKAQKEQDRLFYLVIYRKLPRLNFRDHCKLSILIYDFWHRRALIAILNFACCGLVPTSGNVAVN